MTRPGKTWAEKKSYASRLRSTPSGLRWIAGMKKIGGTWVEVETEHLFEDQFNIGDPDLRIMIELIDDIDFRPEFNDVDEFTQAVQERFDKDWPGRKAKCEILRSYISSKIIEVYS